MLWAFGIFAYEEEELEVRKGEKGRGTVCYLERKLEVLPPKSSTK